MANRPEESICKQSGLSLSSYRGRRERQPCQRLQTPEPVDCKALSAACSHVAASESRLPVRVRCTLDHHQGNMESHNDHSREGCAADLAQQLPHRRALGKRRRSALCQQGLFLAQLPLSTCLAVGHTAHLQLIGDPQNPSHKHLVPVDETTAKSSLTTIDTIIG